VQKRESVQFTFAAAVGGRAERVAFMSAKKPLFFASFFCGSKRKRNKKKISCGSRTFPSQKFPFFYINIF